jgi:hypothetical protein
VESGDFVYIGAALYTISEVLSETKLVTITAPPPGQSVFSVVPKYYFGMHVGTSSYTVPIAPTLNPYSIYDTELQAWLSGYVSDVTVTADASFIYITSNASGITISMDDNSLTRKLGVTVYSDNGAANNEFILNLTGDLVGTVSFAPIGTATLASIVAGLHGLLVPTYLSDVTLDVSTDAITLVGLYGDNTLEMDVSASAQRIFEFTVLNQGKTTSISDIAAAWASTICPVTITESSTHNAIVTINGAQSIDASGTGTSILGIPAGVTTGTTTTVYEGSLVVGDILTSNGIEYDVTQIGLAEDVVTPAMPSLATMCTVTSGGYRKYAATRLLLEPYVDELETLTSGLPVQFWNIVHRQVAAQDKSLALADINHYTTLFSDIQAQITGYNPYGVAEVDQTIDMLNSFGLDDGVWMVTSLMFNKFFFGDVSNMSSAIRVGKLLDSVAGNLDGG